MLPKPEKTSKRPKVLPSQVEQLDLVDTLDSSNKISHKRRSVLIFIILTVGLSLTFWIYRNFKSFLVKPSFNLNIPNFSSRLPHLNQPNFSSTADSVLGPESANWHIYLKTYGSDSLYWDYHPEADFNQSLLDTIYQQLQRQPGIITGPLQESLPQGLTIREISSGNTDSYQSQILIDLPDHPILIIIHIKSTSPQLINSLQPALVKQLYWQLAPYFN